MHDTSPVAEAFARPALQLHDVEGLDQTVERMLELAVKAFEGQSRAVSCWRAVSRMSAQVLPR
jgi:hypothetical protein